MEKRNLNIKLGAYIQRVRKKAGMSQSEVAAAMGINAQNVSEVERGLVSPTIHWSHRLCEALKVDPAKFFSDFYEYTKDKPIQF